jgi:hypothetical protein
LPLNLNRGDEENIKIPASMFEEWGVEDNSTIQYNLLEREELD